MLSWQCRWNCACAEEGVLEESGSCGLNDLPEEVLSKIAECLDLATQVSLWETNKHLYRTLSGQVRFVKDFDSVACSAPLDRRWHAEAFALCGIELLSHLPPFVDLQDSHVQVVYTDRQTFVTVDIRYLEDQTIPGLPDASLFHVKYSADTADSPEYSDGEVDEEDSLLFRDLCDKSEVHKLLCSAPCRDTIPEVEQIASRVVLQSNFVTNGLEDLRQCAQYCFELMCSRRWCSVLYIIFPPPFPGLDSARHAFKISRSLFSSQNDIWSVNNADCKSSPFKLDFALFPQDAIEVQARFSSECFEYLPEYSIGTDLVRQQCMGFVSG